MNLVELQRSLRQLRLGGMARALEPRILEAQSAQMAPIDFLSTLVSDELTIRSDRLLQRRIKHAQFREPDKTLDAFDFDFNKKMNRRLVFELATGQFIDRREDALFLGPPGTGKSHLAQAIGLAAIRQGHRVLYRETHVLLEELADSTIDGSRKEKIVELQTVPLLIIDDLGMRKLPASAAEDLLEVVMRRHERASTLMTSNRPVEDWGKLLGDTPAVAAMLDRLLHHGHVLQVRPAKLAVSPSRRPRKIAPGARLSPAPRLGRPGGSYRKSTSSVETVETNQEADGGDPAQPTCSSPPRAPPKDEGRSTQGEERSLTRIRATPDRH